MGTDRYTSAERYLEPNERENQLAALEIEADLGFASLTSAPGASWCDETGQRDQTDLLITLGFSYGAFPSFSAFTLEGTQEKTFSQELRLVSRAEGPIDQFAVANFGAAGITTSSIPGDCSRSARWPGIQPAWIFTGMRHPLRRPVSCR